MSFCGICTADIPSDAPHYMTDGVITCDECENGEIVARDSERGYSGGDGGIGLAFEKRLTVRHDAIVPRAVVELDRKIVVEHKTADDIAPAWDELSPMQRKYASSRDSNNRKIRKDSL